MYMGEKAQAVDHLGQAGGCAWVRNSRMCAASVAGWSSGSVCRSPRSPRASPRGRARRAGGRARGASDGLRWPMRSGRDGRTPRSLSIAASRSRGPVLRCARTCVGRGGSRAARGSGRTSGPSPRAGPAACSAGRRSSAACAAGRSETATSAASSPPGIRARYGKSFAAPLGGTLSNASHEHTTSRAMRSSRAPPTSSSGPPQSLIASVSSCRSRRFDELAEDLRHSPHRQVGVGVHRMAMGADWQGGQHAAVVAAQVSYHVPPQRAIHDQPVHEQDHRTGPARVLVLDRSR